MATSPTAGALPPPPGVVPNFDHPNSGQRTAFLVGNIVCLVVPTILVALRVYVKAFIVKEFRWADYACLVAWGCFVALVAVALSMLNYGVAIHAWNVPLQSYTKYAETQNIHQIIYMPSILITKLSILLQLLDIFVPQKRNYRWYTLLVLMAANVVFFTILFFMEIFECIPRKKIWNPKLPGSCIDIQRTFVATGVLNVCDDFIILILPVYWVWLLQMSINRKAAISLVFAAGLFACVCSIMRLLESIRDVGSLDITATLAPVTLWAVAEVSSGLAVGCLPVLPRLFFNRNPEHGPSPTYDTNDTSLPSKAHYVEMDDLAFGLLSNDTHLPSTVTDVESRQTPDYRGLDHLAESGNMERPAIVKTVSVKQSITDGG